MLFEAVDRHWALGVPKYKYVRFMIVPETLARIGMLKRGKVDMIALRRETVQEAKDLGFPIVEDPAQAVSVLWTHETWNKDYPVSDVRVRKALNLAIDRKAIHETMFGGYGELAPFVFATPISIGYNPAPEPYPYDPKKARALLKEAGYGPKNPCPIHVYSFSMSNFPESEEVIQVLASQWQQLGLFDVNITKVPEYGVLKKMWTAHKTNGALSPNYVGGRVWSIPVTNIICRSGAHYSTAGIPELDAALKDALGALDPEQRVKLANKVFRIIYQNYIHVPLVMAPGCFAVNPDTVPDWKNWQMGATTVDYNLEWVLFPRD